MICARDVINTRLYYTTTMMCDDRRREMKKLTKTRQPIVYISRII